MGRSVVGRLLDYILLETIFHLQANGLRGLTLNFATLRAVLAGETGDGVSQRIERWLLQKMSGTMQIESLWHFNAKYDRDWRPRYAFYEAPGQFLPAAWAVAKAESFVELPLIGRMLAPKPVEAAQCPDRQRSARSRRPGTPLAASSSST